MRYLESSEPMLRSKQTTLDVGQMGITEGVFFKVMNDELGKKESSIATEMPCVATPSPQTSWKSTERNSFYLQQPLLVSDPESNEPVLDEAEALGRAMQRSRILPDTCFFSNNHIMVNQERKKYTVAPLTRLHELDDIAREHAEAMAASNRLFHSDPDYVQNKFNHHSRRMGENVAVGATIRDIHESMMKTVSDKYNILHRRYTHMGMATAKGSNGQLYLCQVFRG